MLRSLTAVSRVARAAVALWPARDDSPAGQEAYAPEKVAQWLWGALAELVEGFAIFCHDTLGTPQSGCFLLWVLKGTSKETIFLAVP